MAATQVRIGVMKLIGIRVTGTREELAVRVPKAWRELVSRLGEIDGVVDLGTFFGVVPEADLHKLEGAGSYTYLCCTRVRSGKSVPKGMESLIVPAQRYAEVSVRGGNTATTQATLELARFFAENGVATNKKAFGLERFEEKRQSVLAPFGRFDYDVLRPLAERAAQAPGAPG